MRRVALPFAVILLAACAGARPSATKDAPSADEYAVWSAAVDAEFGSTHPRIVVREETYSLITAFRGDVEWLRARSGLPDTLLDDYIARNARPARVRVGRLDPRIVRLLPEPRGSSGSGSERASAGRLTLSRVGFDRGGRRALVTVVYNCGGFNGGGAMLVLEGDGRGHWRRTSTVAGINC